MFQFPLLTREIRHKLLILGKKQLNIRATKGLTDAYPDASSKIQGYMVVDCGPMSPSELKLRTNIFRRGEHFAMLVNEKVNYQATIIISPDV